MFTVDLHTHTRFFHRPRGTPTWFDPVGVRLLGIFSRIRALDGIAITNHDYFRQYESDGNVAGVATIPGIEVSTSLGHVLVVGPNPPMETDPGVLTPNEVADIAHDRGCVAILAHPYRNSTVADSGAALDAVEINGKSPGRQTRVERLAEGLDIPTVGGSDAHYPFEVGRSYTVIDADTLTAGSVVDAINDRRVEVRTDERLSHRALQAGYERIHSWKNHI